MSKGAWEGVGGGGLECKWEPGTLLAPILLSIVMLAHVYGYKSRNASKQAYMKHPKGHYADRSKGTWQGAENAGGSQALF